MKHASLRADAILLLAAALWGAAFVAQRAAMTHIGPLTYNAIRFTLGTLTLLVVVALRARLLPAAAASPTGTDTSWRAHLLGGTAAGVVLFLAATLQQTGVVYTTAGKAGFITCLYVPLVPIFGLAVGERTRGSTWTGAAIAVAGLYLLSAVGSLRNINPGDTLVFFCAIVYAVHVLLVGKLAPNADPLKLAIVQFSIVAVASLVSAAAVAGCQTLPQLPAKLAGVLTAIPSERATLAALRAALWPILYGGLVSVAIAYTLQLVGQRHAPPAHAAILLSLENVFAAVTGYLVLHEVLGARELLGAGLMLAGMLLSQAGRLMPAATAAREERAAEVALK